MGSSRSTRYRRRKYIIERLGGFCADCFTDEQLEIDHIDWRLKEYRWSIETLSIENLEKELKKCQLLCKSCHAEKTRQDLTEQHHKDTNMSENPLKARRLLAGWTQDELANYAGVTHDNVVRNEQGLFNRPSPAIISAIIEYTGESTEKLTKEYIAWIASKRRSQDTRNAFRRTLSFPNADQLSEHPFLLFRKAIAPGMSRIAFCQMICCHPATVLKYEKGQQRPMPSQIYEALKECGMDTAKIDALAKLGSEYFVLRRRRTSGKNLNPEAMGSL